MDRKGILILVLSFGLLMLWFPLVNRLYPPLPAPHLTNQLAQATNQAGALTNLASSPSLTPAPTPAPATAPALDTTASPLVVAPPSSEETALLENEFIRVTLTSHGGGIKLIELKQHSESIACGNGDDAQGKQVTLNTEAPLPVLALLGGHSLQGDGLFKLNASSSSVRAEKLLTNGLLLVKEFSLDSNYVFNARTRIENTSDQAVALPAQQWIAGTATPINTRDPGTYMGVYWYDSKDAVHIDQAWFANRFLGCFPGTPRFRYDGGLNNVRWAAAHNQFFTLAVIPQSAADSVQIVQTNLPPPSRELLQQDTKTVAQPFGLTASLLYPATNLPGRASMTLDFVLYAGPKEYNTLARLGQRMDNNLDLVMNYGGFFGFFAKTLLLSMNGLNSLFGLPYALAIIVITIIIKSLFWPLTAASTRSMKRMAALQPQMKALQAKYKEDPVKMNRKLMEFMKENKVSPLGGCLPMLLQIPVFFGFYQMILSATELRGASFLWACDLSKPDTIFVIPGLDFPVNPLPLIMGVTMFWQASLTPPSPGMDPMQQKMMKYMPLMFLFILYNFSAGLTLYWTVQNLLTIAQTKLTRAAEPAAATPAAAAATPGRPAQPPRPTKQNKKRP